MKQFFLTIILCFIFVFPGYAAITNVVYPDSVVAGESFDFSFTLNNTTTGMTTLSSATLGSSVSFSWFDSEGVSHGGSVLWSDSNSDGYNYTAITQTVSVAVPLEAVNVSVVVYQGLKWGNTRRYQRYSRVIPVTPPPLPDPEPGDSLPVSFDGLKESFLWLLSQVRFFWNVLLNDWSILGTFILFSALIRWVVRVFNRLKS